MVVKKEIPLRTTVEAGLLSRLPHKSLSRHTAGYAWADGSAAPFPATPGGRLRTEESACQGSRIHFGQRWPASVPPGRDTGSWHRIR